MFAAMVSLVAGTAIAICSVAGILYVEGLFSQLARQGSRAEYVREIFDKRRLVVETEIWCPGQMNQFLSVSPSDEGAIIMTGIFPRPSDDHLVTRNFNVKSCEKLRFRFEGISSLEYVPMIEWKPVDARRNPPGVTVEPLHSRSYRVSIDVNQVPPELLDSTFMFLLSGLETKLTFSEREVVLFAKLKNWSGLAGQIDTSIQLPRDFRVTAANPPPSKTVTYGPTFAMHFPFTPFADGQGTSYVQVAYSDVGMQSKKATILTILSALVGLGAAGIFEGLIEMIKASRTSHSPASSAPASKSPVADDSATSSRSRDLEWNYAQGSWISNIAVAGGVLAGIALAFYVAYLVGG